MIRLAIPTFRPVLVCFSPRGKNLSGFSIISRCLCLTICRIKLLVVAVGTTELFSRSRSGGIKNNNNVMLKSRAVCLLWQAHVCKVISSFSALPAFPSFLIFLLCRFSHCSVPCSSIHPCFISHFLSSTSRESAFPKTQKTRCLSFVLSCLLTFCAWRPDIAMESEVCKYGVCVWETRRLTGTSGTLTAHSAWG